MEPVIVLLLSFLSACAFLFLFVQWGKIRNLYRRQQEMTEKLNKLEKIFEEKERNQEKEEVRHHIHMKALDVRDTVYKQTKSPHPQAVHHTVENPGYSLIYLQELFGPERAGAMMQFFQSYQTYVETYWKTENGRVRTVFRKDSSGKGHDEFEYIRLASSRLLREMDELLLHFQ
ncbi:hypothetical protein [Salibacterium sp. K-3]